MRQIVKQSNKPERPKAPDKKKPGKGVRRKERESVWQAAGRKISSLLGFYKDPSATNFYI